jgi:hypothetical protein
LQGLDVDHLIHTDAENQFSFLAFLFLVVEMINVRVKIDVSRPKQDFPRLRYGLESETEQK